MGVFQLQTDVLIKSLLLFTLTLLFILAVRLQLFGKGNYAVREARVGHDGAWRLQLGNGETLPARLLPDSFVKPWLMVLRFKTGKYACARSMVLFPDSLDSSVNRRLRIYLGRSASDPKRSP
jgi:hypothetical protein